MGKEERGVYNLMCCCASHHVHRESDKFRLINKKKGRIEKLDKRVFVGVESGQPVIHKKSFENVVGFNLSHHKSYFPRKKEVSEILEF